MVEKDKLNRAVTAELVESVALKETIDGEIVWQGVVHVFELTGHPSATLVYTWTDILPDGERRVHSTLHTDEIDSAAKAVRAVLAAERARSR